jgi:predicted dehydrogenase
MSRDAKPTRAAVVGVGYLGRFHARKYAGMPEVELAGVADADPERARAVAAEVGTAPYADYRELFGKVDAVSIAVPTPAHFAVARDFLERDVDVLVEKPMTTTVAEADELNALAETRGCILQVGHLERFNPAVVAIRDTVRKPLFIESHRLAMYQPRGTDVSVVLDLMIHDIDIIMNLVKSEVKSIHAAGVAAVSDHVDIANARLEFESGCVANVTASRISMKNERKIRLFQRDAYISLNFADRDVTVVRKNGSEPLAEGAGGIIPGMDIQRFCFTEGDALEDEIRSFVRSVRTREVSEVTGRMARDALFVALAVMDQIRAANRRVLGI